MLSLTLPRSLLAALVLTMLALGTSAATPDAIDAGEAGLQGDVNCGGTVDSLDSLQVLRGVAGLSTNAKCLAEAGDVDCDQDADSTDALRILRHVAALPVSPVEGCTPIGVPLGDELPPTSEALIAEALEADAITYEESLLYRAYALYGDERLDDAYRSPIIDWEAADALFGEVGAAEGELSKELLADLAPFRARPNDPISIFNSTPARDGVAAQGPAWNSLPVPGINARVWIKGGTEDELLDFAEPVLDVWDAMPGIFRQPLFPDQAGDPNATVNPDGAIDFYMLDAAGIDPRLEYCRLHPMEATCLVGTSDGFARRAEPFIGQSASGYLVVNVTNTGDNLYDTIAHELTHVSSFYYDVDETSWLKESTATWSAYKIMKKLNKLPEYAYSQAEAFYEGLEEPLDLDDPNNKPHKYGSWVFFLHASMERGNDIVTQIWEAASAPPAQGINAVDSEFPLDTYFDDFTVRNWNEKPPIEMPYKDAPDATFPGPSRLQPEPDRDLTVPGEADYTLDLPVEPLSARYYRYEFGSAVRHIIVENNLVETEHAHVWLLKKIAGDWKPPEDMAGAPVVTFCRDSETFEEDLEELIVIVSYSEIMGPPLNHHSPRVIADKIACDDVTGWASTSVHIVNGSTDMTYTSGVVNLRFKPRKIQDTPGNVNYDLDMRSQGVHWVASGVHGDCPAAGEATVLFPGGEYTGIEPAGGYLVVVGPGDNHSVLVSAYDQAATYTVTCPGDPPTVSEAPFQAVYLLLILGWPNSDDGQEYSGDCVLYFGDTTTYHFTWNLRAPDVLTPLRERPVEPAGPLPECFDFTPCPPICPRESDGTLTRRRIVDS